MVSNRLLQECLEDFSNIMRLSMALYDRNRTCVAGEEELVLQEDIFDIFCESPADMQALGNRYLFKVGDEEMGYVLSVSGGSKDAYPMGQLAVRQLERILEMGYSREDRNQFIHNLLLDNLLPVDIASYAKQMHLGPDCRWAILLVEGSGCDAYDIQMILKNILDRRFYYADGRRLCGSGTASRRAGRPDRDGGDGTYSVRYRQLGDTLQSTYCLWYDCPFASGSLTLL